MFIVRKNFQNRKKCASYICTDGILNNKKSNQQKFSNKKDEQTTEEQQSSSSQTLKQDTNDPSSDASLNSNFKKKEMKQTASAFKFDPFKRTAASLVKNVAKELGGDKKKITEELLTYLKTLDISDESATSSPLGNNHIQLENVGNSNKSIIVDLGNDSRKAGKRKLNLYLDEDLNFEKSDGETNFFKMTLGIFNQDIMKAKNQVTLKIWDDLEAEELAFQSKCYPKNYFEELINWTNEGKLWHFPIDNDQGLDEEAKISFTEHIFMEQYLEPWCPEKGPLRKFMELVLTGLSKNPYLTVEEKKAHIKWFRDYFEKKKKLLQELGAMGPPKEIEVPKQEQEKNP